MKQAGPEPDTGLPRLGSVTTIRLAAACVLLLGLAFIQDPGFLVADTKFDLVAAPADFLARALHLWDGEAAFGQLQNQAYGYLWPMGPFFLLGSLLDIQGWVVQRLWMGLVMVVAFVGTARVARALGVRSDLACIVAAFAYALSPRMLTTLGPISIEAWPSALAPWVLLPLIRGSVSGSPRRAAALSALAVAMVGGVNAAATFAVIPLGAVWLLTRTSGPRRRRLMFWWPVFTALGTLWWLIPLFLLGAYSPPFLDFIETASITTFPTTIFDSLRGTSAWVPYIDPEWRAGNDLITDFYLPLNSGVVLALGLVGLMARGTRHRQFLVLSLLVGLVMVTAGHLGSVQGWFAEPMHAWLDGVLSPARNIHKFDPVVRLPLVLGVAWAIEVVLTRVRRPVEDPGSGREEFAAFGHAAQRRAILGLALVAVAGASAPALLGRMTPTGGFTEVPGYWQETARWLDREGGLALLLPGSSFASYQWGTPRDEPLQFLGDSPWAVRNAIPLAPAGNIRMLDAIEDRMAQGKPSPGLAAYLVRAGVRHLVVRNDLKRSGDVPDPVLVHQALDESPGLKRVWSFGPIVGGEGHVKGPDGRVVINDGWQTRYHAVEIYDVVSGGARAVATSRLPLVSGGPEDLLDLADLGLIGPGPTQLAVDAGPRRRVGTPFIVTDGLQDRERFFGRVHDARSAVLTPGDRRRSGNPVQDYELKGQRRWSTTAQLTGARRVSASSSMADATAVGGAEPGLLPFAAVDGSRTSAWVSGAGRGEQPWWQVTFDARATLSAVTLTGGPTARDSQLVRLRTAGQVTDPFELGPGETRTVRLEPGRTGWLRVEGAPAEGGRQITVAEVEAGAIDVRRSLVLPALPASWRTPDAIVLRALDDARTGCATVALAVRCSAERARAGEEPDGMSRVVPLVGAREYAPKVTVRARPGKALEQLLQRDQLVNVSSSSVGVPDARGSSIAAIDGDRTTTWYAGAEDARPSLSLSWVVPKRVTGVRLKVAPDVAARAPRTITLVWPGGTRSLELDERGAARFDPIRTDHLEILVDSAEQVESLRFDGSYTTPPIGVTELRLSGVPYLPLHLSPVPLRYPCGTGPTLRVNGTTYDTALEAVPRDLFAMKSVPARVCKADNLKLWPGNNHVEVNDSDVLAVDTVVLDGGLDPVTTAGSPRLTTPSPSERVVAGTGGSEVVVVRENTNPGWHAAQGGSAVRPIVADGWQQGWAVSPDGGRVRIDFAPDKLYRGGLALGLLGLLGLGAGVLLNRRTRARHPALSERRLRPSLLLGLALAGGGLLAGTVGACVMGGSIVAGMLLRRRDEEAAAWLLAGAVLLAAGGYAFRPWGDPDGWAGSLRWPHYLALVSLAGALLTVLEDRRRMPGRLRRMLGRSTTR